MPEGGARRVCQEAVAIVEMARVHADSLAVGVTPVRAGGSGLEGDEYGD